MEGYGTGEAADVLDLAPGRVRALVRAGVVTPTRGARGAFRFTFRDLVLLRVASGLVGAGVPAHRVIRSLAGLRGRLPAGRSLSELRIVADGQRVLVYERGVPCEIESGQFVLDFDVSSLAARVTALPRIDALSQGAAGDAEALYALGMELEESSPAEACRAYEAALEQDPDHADARVNLGRLLHESGHAAAAAKHYRRALEANPTHATAAFNLGVALEDQELWGEAVRAYERAIELHPDLADAHYNLAAIRERQGDRQAALRSLHRYRELTDSPVAR